MKVLSTQILFGCLVIIKIKLYFLNMIKLPKIKKSYLIIIIMLVIIGGIYYWRSRNKSANGGVQYVTAAAENGTLTTSVSASGNVIVDQSATVDPTITGTVADLAVDVGDKVTKGQFLFNIVNDDLGVSVAKAAASYDSAKNSLESAKIDEDDAEANYDAAKKDDKADNDAYTKEELEVLKDKIDLAEDKVVQAEKSLAASLADYNNTQNEAAKRRVTAPISGTVNAVNIKNGDDLSRVSGSSSNAQAPMIIGDLGTLKAQVEVNEVDIPNISIGQKTVLTFDALEGFTATGKVEKMDSLGTIDQGVVIYNVTISFDTLDSRVRPDMSVSANIIGDVKQNVLLVPSSAVKSDSNGDYVEVLNGQTPERKSVQVGVSNNTDTEIVSGINAGENVVTQTITSGTSNATSNSNSRSSSGGGGVRIPGLGGFGR
jgi:macrolide-specific efflux system membrane fusion protein